MHEMGDAEEFEGIRRWGEAVGAIAFLALCEEMITLQLLASGSSLKL